MGSLNIPAGVAAVAHEDSARQWRIEHGFDVETERAKSAAKIARLDEVNEHLKEMAKTPKVKVRRGYNTPAGEDTLGGTIPLPKGAAPEAPVADEPMGGPFADVAQATKFTPEGGQPPADEGPQTDRPATVRHDELPPPPGWTPAPDKSALPDMLDAATGDILFNQNLNSSEFALEEAYDTLINKGRALGLKAPENPVGMYRAMMFGQRPPLADMISSWHAEVGKQLAANPEMAAKLGPLTRETMASMADQMSRDAHAKYLDLKERRGEGFFSLDTLAEFGVGMAASMTDPVQAATAPIGGPSKTILGAAVKGAVVNAGVEVLLQPFVQSRQLELGNVKNWEEAVANGLSNVGLAGAIGFTFSGGGKAFDRAFFEPGRNRDNAMRELLGRIEGAEFRDPASVTMSRWWSDAIEAEGGMPPSRSLAEAFRAAAKTADPEVAARMAAVADQVDREVDRREADQKSADDSFAQAREAMDALAKDTADADPESAALVRRTLIEAERDYATAQQLPDGVEPDQFIVAVEAADARARALEEFSQRPEKPVPHREAKANDPPAPDAVEVARRLKDDPRTKRADIPAPDGIVRQAQRLARLDDEVFSRVESGELTHRQAGLVGDAAPDSPELQRELAAEIVRRAPETHREAEAVVRDVLDRRAAQHRPPPPDSTDRAALRASVSGRDRDILMAEATAWLSGPRSVLNTPLVRLALSGIVEGTRLGGAALTNDDLTRIAVAALLHARSASTRTAVADIIDNAFRSVAEQGVTPRRAGQQVARAIASLVEEHGLRALMETPPARGAEGPDTLPAFDGTGSKAHVDQADTLEGALRPEGIEDPGVDLKKLTETPDEVAGLVDELKGGGDGARTPDQILNDIRKLLEPKKAEGEGEAKPVDLVAEARAEFRQMEQAEKAIRDALLPLTDAQKVALVKRQYPDSYPTLNRLAGADLDDAIVGRVMAGDVKFAKRGGPDGEITHKRFDSGGVLKPHHEKMIEMAINGHSNLDIAIEMGVTVETLKAMIFRAKKRLKDAGIEVVIPPGQTGRVVDGHLPGELKAAVIELAERGMKPLDIHQRLAARGMNVAAASVYTSYWRWKSAKAKGVKYARGDAHGMPRFAAGHEPRDLILMFNDGLDDARIAAELTLGGNTVSSDTISVQLVRVRAALRKLRDTPDLYERALAAMHLTADEAAAFIDDIGRWRVPSMRNEARRMMEAGISEPAALIKGMKAWAAVHLPAAEAPNLNTLGAIASQVRAEFGKAANKHNTVTTPEQRLEIERRRMAGEGTLTIAREVGVTYIGAQGAIQMARLRGVEFPPIDRAVRTREYLAAKGESAGGGSTPDELISSTQAEFGDRAGAMFRVGEVNVVDTPPAWADALTQAMTDANGRVTIFAANVSADMMRGLVLHEVGVHAGLDGILGPRGKEQLLAQVEERLAAGDAAFVTARNRVPADTNPAHVTEETLAYLVQHAPKTPFVQRLLADIRAWLYRTFPALRDHMTLTEADMLSLAIGAVRRRVKEANQAVNFSASKGDGVFSTTGVRYARRQRAEDSISGREVSGGPGRPGRADARADDGAVAGAAQRGDVEPKSQLARAVVTEPLPQPAFVTRRWNDRVELGPEQRAARREQFRDFVNSVEFDVEMSRGNGDFRFRNGKRTGDRGAFEQLTYTLRQADDAHASWADAFDPENTRLDVEIHGGEATIPYSRVANDFRSTGLGQRLYMKAIDDLLARGIVVNSDVSMSDGAVALWKSLRKQGYDVTQRVPDALLERGPDNQLAHSDDSTAIFYIARRKPDAPDLPATDRDVANGIDEARDLTEHLPACLKGKRRG